MSQRSLSILEASFEPAAVIPQPRVTFARIARRLLAFWLTPRAGTMSPHWLRRYDLEADKHHDTI